MKLLSVALRELRYCFKVFSNYKKHRKVTVFGSARLPLEDLVIRDTKIKAGQTVILMLGAANRDPERFPDPDRFDVGRSDNKHLAFGWGSHFCLGAPLARLELEVALPILFTRLPELKLAGRPRYRDTYHFRQLAALEVAWRM